MRNANIVFFYEKNEEKAIGKNLCPNVKLTFLPLHQSLDCKTLNLQHPIVIIYDATRRGKGKNRLKEIRDFFPLAPVFLIAKDPSKEYLKTALEYKVTQYFPLPIDQGSVTRAIEKKVNQERASSAGKRLARWINVFFGAIKDNFKKLKTSENKEATSAKSLDVLGITPASFRKLIGKDLEQRDAFDVQVQFFGQLKITIRGKTLSHIKGKKNASVLAYLLFNHHRSVHRDILIDKFWSDFSSASAKNSLNVAICSIRKDLAKVLKDQEVILFENESYCINPQLEIITDVEKFTYMWRKGRVIEEAQGLSSALHAYNKAVALYQKEFLENFRFEEWCESERSNLQEIYLFILNRLSAYFFEEKNYYGCINICKKMLSTDRCLEEVYRKLMKCYYALGLTDMAFKQYFKCKKALKEELDLSPSRPTEELFESMQLGQVI